MSLNAVLTVDQMRAAEQAAMAAGVSEWELMQRAGQGAAQWVHRMAAGRDVCVLCGPGNNGGDGYVIAEELLRSGYSVSLLAPMPPHTDTARTARANFHGDIIALRKGLPAAAVYVDCLFGYGLARPVEGEFGDLLVALQSIEGFRIAIDLPSSVGSDSGAAMGPEVHYDLTLALGAWKRAHFAMPAMAHMGAKRLIDIGLSLPEDAPRLAGQPTIAPPAADAHKYRRGLLAVVAGEMPGAPLLAAQAAMRSGAGYVKLLSDTSLPAAPAELVLDDRPLADALADPRLSALLLGPGLGRDEAARARLQAVLAAGRPTVLDADALHLLDPAMIAGHDTSRISLTPHEGELAQLCDAFGVDAGGKIARAQALYAQTGMTVLAKGPDTVLASGAGLRIFERGSPWLSAAGTGDVLAGIAASRLAVHGEPARALEEAVWLHHEAARLAGPGFTAGDLADTVTLAMENAL